MFVDADDFMLNGWYNIIKNSIDLEDYDMHFFENDIVCNKKYNKEDIIDNIFKVENELQWCATVWSKLYSRKLLIENKITFKEDIINGEDMLFNLECVMCSNKLNYVKNSIYKYRINSFSATQIFKREFFELDKRFLYYLKKLGEKYMINVDIHYFRCLENAIIIFCNKLSLITKQERQKYIRIFKEEPYNSYIINSNIFLNKKNKLIISLLKKEKYTPVIVMMKLNNIIKNISAKECIVKI